MKVLNFKLNCLVLPQPLIQQSLVIFTDQTENHFFTLYLN